MILVLNRKGKKNLMIMIKEGLHKMAIKQSLK